MCCLNPQRKRACIEARRRQEEALRASQAALQSEREQQQGAPVLGDQTIAASPQQLEIALGGSEIEAVGQGNTPAAASVDEQGEQHQHHHEEHQRSGQDVDVDGQQRPEHRHHLEPRMQQEEEVQGEQMQEEQQQVRGHWQERRHPPLRFLASSSITKSQSVQPPGSQQPGERLQLQQHCEEQQPVPVRERHAAAGGYGSERLTRDPRPAANSGGAVPEQQPTLPPVKGAHGIEIIGCRIKVRSGHARSIGTDVAEVGTCLSLRGSRGSLFHMPPPPPKK